VRYWAASTGPGKDAIISEEKIQMGARLVTKLWNVARFAERFIAGISDQESADPRQGSLQPDRPIADRLSPADRWILSRTQKLVRRATAHLQGYDYAAAKSEIEAFFWTELADNYLEMAKQRLYDPAEATHAAACNTLHVVLLTTLKLFAPFLPYVTEEIYQGIGDQRAGDRGIGDRGSIHRQSWPVPDPALEDDAAEGVGQTLVEIATAVRRYKSERNLPLGSELNRVQLAAVDGNDPGLEALRSSVEDLKSITRAREIAFGAADSKAVEFARLERLCIFIDA
jgi:valyl-tRNA synthetase